MNEVAMVGESGGQHTIFSEGYTQDKGRTLL